MQYHIDVHFGGKVCGKGGEQRFLTNSVSGGGNKNDDTSPQISLLARVDSRDAAPNSHTLKLFLQARSRDPDHVRKNR